MPIKIENTKITKVTRIAGFFIKLVVIIEYNLFDQLTYVNESG
jgi:hypothetical protein